MEDKPMTLTCKVIGLPRPDVAWFRDGKELIPTPNIKQSYEDDTATLTINKMTMDQDGEYKCIAENSAGVAETAAKVTVEGKNIFFHSPIIIYEPGSEFTNHSPEHSVFFSLRFVFFL